VLLIAALCAGAFGCAENTEHKKAAAARRTIEISITDDLQQVVTLTRPAQRIASLSPSNTEILYSLGCGGRVVLRDTLSTFPADAKKLPATNSFQLSPEHVAGFEPDLVLLSHADLSRTAALRRIGLAVATFDPKTLEQLYGNLRSVGELCGARRKARVLERELRGRVERVAAAVKGRDRPRVYIETDGTDPLKPWTAGAGSFVDQLVRLAGGRNVVGDLGKPYAQINAEEILSSGPDLILLMGVGQVGKGDRRGLERMKRRQGWNGLKAVREGRIIDTIHADLLSRPGPRLVDGLEALARALHPESLTR
jgi:iron complex transport system substrate-binding protein